MKQPTNNEPNENVQSQATKAYYENPLKMLDAMGYKSKPTTITYNVLQQMAVRNAVIASIIVTRINQVSTFTKPARYNNDHTGYEIRLRDPNQIPTAEQKKMIQSLEMFLENCGFNHDPDRDDFDTFIRKIVRDSLTYDQVTFEIVPDRLGRPAEFIAVDAATIRAASESYRPDEGIEKDQSVKWVQVLDGAIKAWFTSSELAFGTRNPRTDINLQPYGFSELEQLIHQVTSHLYAEEYNARFFSQGGTTKGIINLKVDTSSLSNAASQEQLESFKRQWRAQVSGLTGAWKTPVLQIPNGIDYINVSQSNREMEFEKWMNYLINIACAVYQIDPAEVNFPNNGGVGGSARSLFNSGTDDKLKNSRDKGLRPLLRFIETLLNKHIISRFSQDFVFNFVGMDAKSEKDRMELDAQRIKLYSTVNEVRKENGLEALEFGDVILDTNFVNYMLQTKQAEKSSEPLNNFEQDESLKSIQKSFNDYEIMEIIIN